MIRPYPGTSMRRALSALLAGLLTLLPGLPAPRAWASASAGSSQAAARSSPAPVVAAGVAQALSGVARLDLRTNGLAMTLSAPSAPTPRAAPISPAEQAKIAFVLQQQSAVAAQAPAAAGERAPGLLLPGGRRDVSAGRKASPGLWLPGQAEEEGASPAESLEALAAFREVYGDKPLSELRAMLRDGRVSELNALAARMWDGLRARREVELGASAPAPQAVAGPADIIAPRRPLLERAAQGREDPVESASPIPVPEALRAAERDLRWGLGEGLLPAEAVFVAGAGLLLAAAALAFAPNLLGAALSVLGIFLLAWAFSGRSDPPEDDGRVTRAEKLAEFKGLERRWQKKLEGAAGPGGRVVWGEREATALFGAYVQLDWRTAKEFYERVFKTGLVERMPAAVHADYILALNRLGLVNEAIREAEAALGGRVPFRVNPYAERFIRDEFLIGAGTAFKNRAIARENFLWELEDLQGDLAGAADLETALGGLFESEGWGEGGSYDRILRRALRYVHHGSMHSPTVNHRAMPSLYHADGRAREKEEVDRAAFLRDLARLISPAGAARLESMRASNREDYQAALAYYSDAYANNLTQYAGSNVLRMLVYLGGEENLRKAAEIAPLVRESALMADRANYFWPKAALLELELLEQAEGYQDRVRRLLPEVVEAGRGLPLELDSLVYHLDRWRELEAARGASAGRLGFLQEVLDVLESRDYDRVPEDSSGRAAREFEKAVYRMDALNRAIVFENNLRYNGIVPATLINYTDLGVVAAMLEKGRAPDGTPILDSPEPVVARWATGIIERAYGLLDGAGRRVFEDLKSPEHHRQFETLLPKAIEFMGARVSRHGATNVALAMLFGVGDCRFTNFSYQLLLEGFNRMRRKRVMREAFGLVQAGRHGDAAAVRERLKDLSSGQFALMQAKFELPIRLNKNAKGEDQMYDFARDAQGRMVVTEDARDVESHTFTLRLERRRGEDGSETLHVRFFDVWYHEVYEMQDAVIPPEALADFDAETNRRFTVNMRVMVKPANEHGPAEYREMAMTVKPEKYSSQGLAVIPNRYTATDAYFFSHRVDVPDDAADILLDPERHARWRADWEAAFNEGLILRNGRGARITQARAHSAERIERYPLLELFVNRGALYGPAGAPPADVADRVRERLKELARERQEFFGSQSPGPGTYRWTWRKPLRESEG